ERKPGTTPLGAMATLWPHLRLFGQPAPAQQWPSSSAQACRLRRQGRLDSKEKRPRAQGRRAGFGGGRGAMWIPRRRKSHRRLGHRQSGNCRPQQRAGKADVRHAHGPGSTALELWPCELAQARATGIKTKTKKRGGGCEAGGKGQRG
ncbi:unnamed protein product, partial [Prorocentrum cordatum]